MKLEYKDRFESARKLFDEAFVNIDHVEFEINCMKKALSNILDKNRGIGLKMDNEEYILYSDSNKEINISPTSEIIPIKKYLFKEGHIYNISFY